MKKLLLALLAGSPLLVASAFGALPAPDPDDGGITLPPGFRALVYADNLTADRRVGNSRVNLQPDE